MENVRTMFSHNSGNVFKKIVRAIIAMGYQVTAVDGGLIDLFAFTFI